MVWGEEEHTMQKMWFKFVECSAGNWQAVATPHPTYQGLWSTWGEGWPSPPSLPSYPHHRDHHNHYRHHHHYHNHHCNWHHHHHLHQDHDQDNERRLTGVNETSSIHDFSAGVANRLLTIKIMTVRMKDDVDADPHPHHLHPHHPHHADHLHGQGLQHPNPTRVRRGEKRLFGGSAT